MLSLLKGFAVFVAATLGTTAIISHAPKASHVHPMAAAGATLVVPDSPSDQAAERYVLRPRTPIYVPPAPTPVEETAAAPAAAAPTYSAPAPAPAPQVSIGSTQQALINSDRVAAGLPPLSWSGCLAGIAAGQDAAMIAAGKIFHGSGVNQDFGCGLGSHQTGENVGYWSGGIDDGRLNTMFLNSPEHRANIMGPYRYVGTAWRVAPNGFAYIAVEFG